MPLNDTDDLEREMRSSGAEYDDLDFNYFLQQANRKLAGMVGTEFVEEVTIQEEERQEVQLAFNELESFDRVVNLSDNRTTVDSSDYTENLNSGTVTFDQSFVDDNFFRGLRLKFVYVPSLFKTLEVKQAKELILSQEVITTNDQVENARRQAVQETINNLMYDINSRVTSSKQYGDNQNRGSRAPGDFNR